MQLPGARGPLSECVIQTLSGRPTGRDGSAGLEIDDPLVGDDFHLALYLCYELHYTSIEGVDPRLEWDTGLIRFRSELEAAFESALLSAVPREEIPAESVIDRVLGSIEADDGRSLSHFIAELAGLDQIREFCVHRSAYQLKEADPHSWVIPRLRGPAKAALVEIQSDEYGGGRADRVHSHLFERALIALGLNGDYGAYIDLLPGHTLATVNLVSMFGLNRRLRGAAVGHLATFEATSSEPNGRYARGIRRHGFDGAATEFFDEHVEADSVHEVIAIHDLVGGLVRDEPELAADIVWGAACLLRLERIWAERLLDSWRAGRSSLLDAVLVP